MDLATNSDLMPICVDTVFRASSECVPRPSQPREILKWENNQAHIYITDMQDSQSATGFDGSIDQLNSNLINTISAHARSANMATKIDNNKKLIEDKP